MDGMLNSMFRRIREICGLKYRKKLKKNFWKCAAISLDSCQLGIKGPADCAKKG